MTSDNCKIIKNDFEFPPCWNNDIRINALFAPFRSKTINPTDWTSKMNFWTNLIENWCKYNKCPLVDIFSLKHAFSRKGAIPACLKDVLQHLQGTGTLIAKDNITFSNESWKSWVIKALVKVPLKWTYDTITSKIIGRNNEAEIVYVHLPAMKYLGEDLIKQIPPSFKGKLISFDDILKIWTANNEENTVLILKWLEKEGMIGICEDNGHVFVKMPKYGTKNVITETDKGIYHLERQAKILENNIEKLELEKNVALEDTRKHIKAKMKNMAKISLRRKKEIEKTIEKRMITLDNIQALLHRIDEVKLDSEVIECYQKGLETLKKVFKETGLSEETVTGTMCELEEGLDIGREIEKAMSRPLDPSLNEILEDELNDLLLQDLPKVPEDKIFIDDLKKKKEKKSEEQFQSKLEALNI